MMNQRKSMALVGVVTITAVMMISLLSTPIGNDAFAKKYEKSQAASQANACGNGDFPFNIFCQNIDSQLQGDGNAINIIALQPSSSQLRLLP
jgi:hypothetical protein